MASPRVPDLLPALVVVAGQMIGLVVFYALAAVHVIAG
jgi:hypothetical protein